MAYYCDGVGAGNVDEGKPEIVDVQRKWSPSIGTSPGVKGMSGKGGTGAFPCRPKRRPRASPVRMRVRSCENYSTNPFASA